ncbi:MAG TPA: hypothetical protein VHV53_10825 [Solirubrobacterales bacterium]|jgi:hypothetical protein|nr:hypothetical protein [Solirubrobacterales bacterium]
MGARAVRWTCARCEVSAGRIDGEPARLPDTWSRTEGDTYCLSCSRALAGEAAVVSAPESTSREDRARLQRSALIAFEIARTPAAPNRTIANACRTSAMAVAAVRDALAARSAPDRAAHGGT